MKKQIRKKPGRFIVLDGPDGAGKTTQSELLFEMLKAKGVKVHLLREPGGTQAGEAIRNLVLEQKKIALSPLAETFLFQAARAQLVRDVIRPALALGEWVLCDRFSLSTLVYQGYAGGVKKKTVKAVSDAATDGLEPDLYLVLWVPLEVGVVRRAKRKADRMESKGIEFLNDVAKAFENEARKHPKKYALIDGRAAVEDVQKSIWKCVKKLLKQRLNLTPESKMIWDELIGQSPAKAYLRTALNSKRLAHAYLFTGPAGVGKRTAAALFAQTALCHNPAAPDSPCGVCQSCRWFKVPKGGQIEHPDLIAVLVQKKFKSGGDDGRVQFEEKRVGDHEPIIKLEAVQYICEQLHRSPMAGPKRAVIIPEAQRMCKGQAEPANAFLKTLEEPPESSLIILTSSQPEALLETIVSRVQAVQFKRLSVAEVAEGLTRRWPGIDADALKLGCSMADGSIGRACELFDGDLKKWRQLVISALATFTAKNFLVFGLGLWAAAEAEGVRLFEKDEAAQDDSEDRAENGGDEPDEETAKTEAGWKRHVFTRLLTLAEICFRDGLLAAAANNDAAVPLLQPDCVELTRSLAAKFGVEGCEKALHALREALLATRLYVRGDVIGRALSGRLRDALVLE